MKQFGMFIVAGLAFGLGGATPSSANNLIVNGSFETPSAGTGDCLCANGTVPGWTTTDPSGIIEIDDSAAFGGSAYDGTQSLEVNAFNPEDVQQTVSGLTIGQSYILSWAYGDRPGSGDEEMQVYLGSSLVTTDYDNLEGSNPSLLWSPNSFVVTATATSEVLSFNGIYVDGDPSVGNEVDAVSLDQTPEPSTLLYFATGLGVLGYAWRRRGIRLSGKQ